MATYGVEIRTGNPFGGFIRFTGWTPILTPNQSPPSLGGGTATGFVQFNGQTQNDDRIAKAFRKVGPSLKFNRQVFNALIGAAVGAQTGTFSYKWVKGSNGDTYNSLRPIDNFGIVYQSRATTASDINAFKGIISRTTAPAVYARDLSGAGGGGKVRY